MCAVSGQACELCVTPRFVFAYDVSAGRLIYGDTFMYLCGSGKVENCGKLKAVHSHARGHGDSTPAATPMEFNMRATRRGDTCDWQAGERARALVQQVRAEVRVGAWARSDHDTARKPTGHGRAAVSPQRCGGARAPSPLVRAAKELPCAELWHHGLRSGGGMSAA